MTPSNVWASIDAAMTRTDDDPSYKEISEKAIEWGVNRCTASTRLRKLEAAGVLESKQVLRRGKVVTVYRPVEVGIGKEGNSKGKTKLAAKAERP